MNTGTKTGRLAIGLAVGALVGTALGVLVAPQPGKQTRNLVRRKTSGYVSSVRGKFRRNGVVNGIADYAETHAELSS